MKAVLGLLFLLVGFGLGWIVISGKLPTLGGASSPSVTSSSPALGNITDQQINQRKRNQNAGIGGGPIGLPTTRFLNDLGASRGLS